MTTPVGYEQVVRERNRMASSRAWRTDWIRSVDTPAAMDTMSLLLFTVGDISRSTRGIAEGLTARTTTSANEATSALLRVTGRSDPESRLRVTSQLSDISRSRGATTSFLTQPLTIADHANETTAVRQEQTQRCFMPPFIDIIIRIFFKWTPEHRGRLSCLR